MDNKDPRDAELMEHFAGYRRGLLDFHIEADGQCVAAPAVVRKDEPTSNLGDLDILPPELVDAILALLDFRTLTHVQRACRRRTVVVNSLPEYRAMVKYAPDTLVALSRSRLIQRHSAAALHATVYTGKCCSCASLGPFLFLPSAKRCCSFCMQHNPRLWVIPLLQAKQCFGTTPPQLKHQPATRSLPGVFYRRRVQLSWPVEALHTLAVEVKSIQERHTSKLRPRANTPDPSAGVVLKYKYLRAILVQPSMRDFPTAVRKLSLNMVTDENMGIAMIVFPYLNKSGVREKSFWCKICRLAHQRWPQDSQETLDHARELAYRAWTCAGMLAHLAQSV